MYCYRAILLFLFSLICFSTRCQQAKSDTLLRKLQIHQYVKFSPLHLLNVYPTVQIGYEYRWGRWFGIQTEAGYILPYSIFGTDAEFLNRKGAKALTEFRYYFAGATPKQQHYTALELYGNGANFDRETSTLECFDAECTQTYSRRNFYQVKYREQGLTLKYGLVWYSKRLMFDINWGLRVRKIDYKKPAFIDQNDNDTNFWKIPDETKRTTWLPVTGMRIGWRLR